ncbi:hypothetical protein [Salinimicrobium sp. GXAS 041]|uniref:hypothetical protein n=1 Tax=Salinimicrobium sp. GXAS 041 TaxID=3400806 RepID=UPI003C759F18
MGYLDNFKSKEFWIDVFKLGIIFFVTFVILSLLISNFGNIMDGDFQAVYENEWSNGKWKRDLAIKAAITLVYAVYMTSRRRKAQERQSAN